MLGEKGETVARHADAAPMTGGHRDAIILGVFALTLIATFVAAWLGRRHGGGDHGGLADEKLNRWLIGLSAGAAANSGFVVTGAVGLGYVGGLTWLLLPFGWLLGDILFWRVFPQRINAFGKTSRATTLSELLTYGLDGRGGFVLSVLAALLVTVCLGGYVAAQWLAGQKFLAGAFGVPGVAALALFALLIVSYTAIGGFRGSVYVDSLQAVIRLVGTTIALAAVFVVAKGEPQHAARLAAAGPGFLSLLGEGGIGGAIGMLLGIGAASLGFGLGQPQLVSRYLAGASPAETQSAWWIYIGFVQFTWIAMTLFGVWLRGVMPGLPDPEAGVSVFFEARVHPVLTGIIIADIFATIAATSNALLVAMGQAIAHDLAPRLTGRRTPLPLAPVCLGIGVATMALSLVIDATVQGLALGSVALIGAGLAPAVMVRVLGWRHSAASLIAAVAAGVATALLWRAAGLGATLNEALPGIAAGLAANGLVARFGPDR
jgi:sodium/proline symporter